MWNMRVRIRTALLAIVTMVAVSCAIDIVPAADLAEITFTATGENVRYDDHQTKACFADYPKIAWQAGDEISVLGADTGNQKFVAVSSGHETTFEGRADLSDEKYYAVYPYDSNVTLNTDGTLSGVIIPHVQAATADNFDPKAYVALAQTEDKENLSFSAVGAFVRFIFENFGDVAVKSVTLKTDGTQVMAGTDSGSVKLQGSFDTGKSYFMIVLPSEYSAGVTVYIELEDGTVISRTGKNPLFESGKSRNYIRTMILDKTQFTEETDQYALYCMGYDVKAGGKVINKNTDGEAVLINATSSGKGIGKSGIYFIEDDVTATFNSGITGKLVVIGNGETRATVNRSGVSYLTASQGDDVLIMKNVNYTDCVENLFQLNAAYIFESIIFEDCLFNVATGKNLLLYSTSANTINEFRMTDCDVRMDGSVCLVKMGEYTIDKISFENNVMYADEPMTSFFALNSSATVNSIVFDNNTLYNTTIGTTSSNEDAVVKAYKSNSFQVKNNYLVDANSTANRYLGRAIFRGGEVDNNFYVRKEGTTTSIYGVPGSPIPSWVISQPVVKAAPDNLTANWDPANGKYTLGGFAGVGAKR